MKGPQDLFPDPLGSFGPAIRQHKPAPSPTPVAPGIVRNSAVQLETAIAPPAPVWTPITHIPTQVDWGYGNPIRHTRDEQCED